MTVTLPAPPETPSLEALRAEFSAQQPGPGTPHVTLADLPAYLARNAPAGEATLTLFLVRAGALHLTRAVTVRPPGRLETLRGAAAEVGAQDGDVLLTRAGPALLCARLCARLPQHTLRLGPRPAQAADGDGADGDGAE